MPVEMQDKGKDEAYSETIGQIHKLAGKRHEPRRRTRFDDSSLVSQNFWVFME